MVDWLYERGETAIPFTIWMPHGLFVGDEEQHIYIEGVFYLGGYYGDLKLTDMSSPKVLTEDIITEFTSRDFGRSEDTVLIATGRYALQGGRTLYYNMPRWVLALYFTDIFWIWAMGGA